MLQNSLARWRQYEKRVRSSTVFRGYRVKQQKQSTSTGMRPDFFGVSRDDPRQRIVADAKYVKELTPQHVDQVRKYKGHPFYAQEGVIFVKKTTRVPEDVREYARDSSIRIIRKRARVDF